jgi:dihydroorotate dehydrogenase
MGGVADGEDALELILAGATCVGIGTAMFRDQRYKSVKNEEDKSIFQKVADYLIDYLKDKKFESISDLVGMAAEGVGT